MKIALFRGLVLLSAAVLWSGCSKKSKTPGIFGPDVIVSPGNPAQAEVLLSGDDKSYTKTGAQEVVFRTGGKELARARNDKAGVVTAELALPADGAAVHTVETLTLDGQTQGTLNVWSVTPDRTIILATEWALLDKNGSIHEGKNTAVRGEVADVLRALSAAGKVPAYALSGDASSINSIRAWLRAQGLPDGAVLLKPDYKSKLLGSAELEALRHTVRRLREQFRGEIIAVGVGAKEGEVLSTLGINRIILFPEKPDIKQSTVEKSYPRTATLVRSWADVRRIVGGGDAPPDGQVPPPPDGQVPPPPVPDKGQPLPDLPPPAP